MFDQTPSQTDDEDHFSIWFQSSNESGNQSSDEYSRGQSQTDDNTYNGEIFVLDGVELLVTQGKTFSNVTLKVSKSIQVDKNCWLHEAYDILVKDIKELIDSRSADVHKKKYMYTCGDC
jgi:hypothetical protein